jgi:c-di-GMP-binding flagellar brake protein YcgR
MESDRKLIEATSGLTQQGGGSPRDRRVDSREASDIEVLVAWAHAPRTPVRYRAIDISSGGMRIRSMLPIAEGAQGNILSSMPHAALPNRSFQAVWCRKATTDDGSGMVYEAGLRFDA